jgi:integrase
VEGEQRSRMNELIQIDRIPGYGKLLEELEQRVFGDVKDWNTFELRFLRGVGLKPGTYRNWRSGCKAFFEGFLGMRKSPFRITIQDIEVFFNRIYEQKSPQTAGVRITQLRAFFKKFCSTYPICRDPFHQLDEKLDRKFRVPQKEQKERRYLRSDEIERLFKYLIRIGELRCYYLYVLTRFLFNTGLRINEYTQLQWKHFEYYNDQDGMDKWRFGSFQKAETAWYFRRFHRGA